MTTFGTLDVLFLLGADEIKAPDGDLRRLYRHPWRRGAHRADVILPGAAYTEKSGDLRQHRGPRADGRPRRLPAGRGPRGLGDPARAVRRLGEKLPYDSLAELRQAIFKAVPHLTVSTRSMRRAPADRSRRWPGKGGSLEKRRSSRSVEDFYLTNPIARAWP